jgi:hypothetical protein
VEVGLVRRIGQAGFQVGDQRLVHHVVHDGARSVVGAGGFAGGGGGFGVAGGQEVFEDLAGQFGVEGDLLVQRGVFGDGEVVAVEDVDEATDFGAAVVGFAIGSGKVHHTFLAKEEEVGDVERVFRVIGEVLNALVGSVFPGAIDLVEVLEQTTVEEGNSAHQLKKGARVGEVILVSVEAVVGAQPLGCLSRLRNARLSIS